MLGCRTEEDLCNMEKCDIWINRVLKTSLGVQWLGLRAPSAGGPGSIPFRGTGSHILQLKILSATIKA